MKFFYLFLNICNEWKQAIEFYKLQLRTKLALMNIVRLLSSVTLSTKIYIFSTKKKSTKIYKKLIFLSFSRFLTGLLLLFCSLSMTCQASHCSLTQHFPSVSVQVARGKLLPIHTVSLLRIKIRDVIIISIF